MASSILSGISGLAKAEADYPGITSEIDNRITSGFYKLPPKTQNEILWVGGILIPIATGALIVTGHPLQAAELSGILAGFTFLGHALRQKLSG